MCMWKRGGGWGSCSPHFSLSFHPPELQVSKWIGISVPLLTLPSSPYLLQDQGTSASLTQESLGLEEERRGQDRAKNGVKWDSLEGGEASPLSWGEGFSLHSQVPWPVNSQ